MVNNYQIGRELNDLTADHRRRGYRLADRNGRTVLMKEFTPEGAEDRLRDLREERRELQDILDDAQSDLQDVADQIEQEGFERPPPLPSDEQLEDLSEEEAEEVRNLRRDWSRISFRIPGIRRDVQTTEEEIKGVRDVHVVPVVEIEYDVTVVAEYEPTNREEVAAKGTKVIRLGIEPPQTVDPDTFWERKFNEVRTEILEDPPNPQGKWFDKLSEHPDFAPGSSGQEGVIGTAEEDFWTWKIREEPFNQATGGGDLSDRITRTAEQRDLEAETV